MKTLVSLQYLRAVAAIGVVLVHALERRGWTFDVGQMGVDIFFVLSGLMMWLIAERTPRTPAQFFADRLGRIAPTYWLATVFVLALWVGGVRAGLEHPETWHTIKSFLFIPAEYPGKDKVYPLVIPGWTLNYEMFFYAIFAAALFAKTGLRLVILTGVILALVTIGAVFPQTGAIGAAYTDPIMLEFLAGVWLGVFWSGDVKAGPAICILLVILGVAMAGILAWLAPGAPRLLAWGAPSLLIVAGVALYERSRPVRRWSWWLLLGDASYAIYLWHFPTNTLWDRLGQMMHAPDWLAVALMVAGGVGFGVAAHLLVEKPIRNRLRHRRKPGDAIVLSPQHPSPL